MKDVLGMINLMNEQDDLSTLTRNRCVGAVPFAGRYRMIDFALSNMSNSGIQKVMLLSNAKADSLLDHVGDGHHWGLDTTTEGGVTVLPPFSTIGNLVKDTEGDLLHLYSHIDLLRDCNETYILIAPSSVIYHMNFENMVDYHLSNDADITILYKHLTEMDRHAHIGHAYNLEMNDQGRVISVTPTYHALPSLKPQNIDLDTMIIKRSLLIELIEQSMRRGSERYLKDVIWSHLADMDVQGYANHGYVAIMDSIDSYYAHSMHLLQPHGWHQFMINQDSVYTKQEVEEETACHDNALIRNSFIAHGCSIEGYVENSILFPGVKVNRGASIKNSIVMHQCAIADNAYLDHVILDKQVVVEQGAILRGQFTHPFVAEKNGVTS
ncbi:glucose-1-phosphate adenylyltransferase subunit GlgD [Paenibacillus pectinilyticus]|uniref:Glucose-1-phosphate adenylyltransferase subunit GlgD n=1 Tax=Paenibacillus pectinilyticus TaxID=512399 RepID=A0A1C0ZUG7_9BACL|nr:glucose-1-phosphate adenylyltransferase subunit GlgD [Paenibacillus pectinilyticus]OCT11750.1 glucose-1-phosphate adenylyltransferase subunit GlgD [Paenibacillus pectinilyticus]